MSRAKQILSDPKFENGFGVMGTENGSGYRVVKVLDYNGEAKTPWNWRLAQWGTRYSFESIGPAQKRGTAYRYENEGKVVEADPEAGSVYLLCKAENEYTRPRAPREMWPHVLVEEVFDPGARVKFSDMKRLTLTLDFEITECENLTGAGYDPEVHTAQVSWYLTANSQVKGNDDYFWFGVPLYDYRFEAQDEGAMIDFGTDTGTKKLIRSIGTKRTFPEPVRVGERRKLRLDALPLIAEAYGIAKERGCLQGLELSDLALGSMNLGWEVPGTFRCGIKLYEIGIEYEE